MQKPTQQPKKPRRCASIWYWSKENVNQKGKLESCRSDALAGSTALIKSQEVHLWSYHPRQQFLWRAQVLAKFGSLFAAGRRPEGPRFYPQAEGSPLR